MKKAFITGITGQDGAYLSKLLLDKGYKVYGLVRRTVNRGYDNLEYLGIDNEIEFVPGDMIDEASLISAIKYIRPDEVYNLAAQSFVGDSWNHPMVTSEINAMGTTKLLHAIKELQPYTKFYQASTSEMFGHSHTDGVQNEKTSFHPRNPYGITKLYAFWMVDNYRKSHNIFCANGILFNHESPIRGKEFVTRKISHAVATIKSGLQDHIRLGNIEAKRDWGFAGDYVNAMWLMMQKDEAKDYVIATGRNHSIKDFLKIAFSVVGIQDWEPYVKIDPAFWRPLDTNILRGDSTRAKEDLGWEPKVGFEELVTMMVEADMKRLSKKEASI